MKIPDFAKGFLVATILAGGFSGVRAVAGGQQIIPNREAVALEAIARELHVLNSDGLRIRTSASVNQDNIKVSVGLDPIRVKIEDRVNIEGKMTTHQDAPLRLDGPLDVKLRN